MKNWKILTNIKNSKAKISSDKVIKTLLENRGIKTRKAIEEFLSPKLESVTIDSVGIDKQQLKKAVARIRLAMKNKEEIAVFGDYDVDGICGTAILWETLNSLGAKIMPYIPHRIEEGYGLSEKGIENLRLTIKNCRLIITVDNGIVANTAVDYALSQGMDVIITDHHVVSKNKPKALAIVHTTKLCGTGVAWMLSQEFKKNKSHWELVALATVADLVPLIGANRTLLKFGLEELSKTKRVGLLELFKEADLSGGSIDTYEIGHIIAPRLNAMGRLEYAMDSLRLICTTNQKRAEDLARLLGKTNRERQDLTLQMVMHAMGRIKNQKSKIKNLLFVVHESYDQGVIGLVAGKLVEEFYRPAIVISKGENFSKASARSISGFDMIEFIRSASEFLVDAGGHPMAAGFTVETAKLPQLQKTLEKKAGLLLNKDLLTRNLKIDCELPLSGINKKLYSDIEKLKPFGMASPQPVFMSKKVEIQDIRTVGKEGSHLKLKLFQKGQKELIFDGIGFGLGEKAKDLHIGDLISIAYVISLDDWNGQDKLQLTIKDLRNN
jgi:single-stranded-DNA-specific exonuclease